MFSVRKDPSSTEDYSIDWSKWLAGETLSSAQWIVSSGLEVLSEETSGSLATVRLRGGEAGMTYIATCRATSSSGRVQDQSIVIVCEEM